MKNFSKKNLTMVLGAAFLAGPFALHWFIHGSSERYIWIINGPAPFDSFGSGPFQLFMHAFLASFGILLIFLSTRQK